MRPLSFLVPSAFLLLCAASACSGGAAASGDDTSDTPGAAGSDTRRSSRDAGGGDDPEVPTPPSLRSATARVTGVSGQNLTIEVVGDDAGEDVAWLHVTFEDASGAPVNLAGGEPGASAQTRVEFDESLDGQASFVGRATLPRVVRDHPEIATVRVAAEDETGLRSNDVEAAVQDQPVQDYGDACDPEYLENRCQTGFGCVGEPAACRDGEPPQIVRIAYLREEDGARLLIAGEEPEDDLDVITLDFLDARGEPVLIDLDNDESPESQSFEIDAEGMSLDGDFFVAIEPTETFVAQVERIAATPRDGKGHVGETKVVKLERTPVRGVSATCDARGFDACGTGLTCMPGDPSVRNSCQRVQTLRPRVCEEAAVLDPFVGKMTATGTAAGGSLWDAPSTCAAGDPVGRPEGVVLLRLTAATTHLTLSIDAAETTFDTVMYLLDDCAADGSDALGCSDDTADGASSFLSLGVVPAGDYLVVVDSWGPDGGDFVVTVAVE